MSGKKCLSLIVIFLAIQILFSFYYSSEIINQNNILSQNQAKYNQLTTNNQQLLTQWSSSVSIKNLKAQIASQSYTLIQNNLDLNSNQSGQ